MLDTVLKYIPIPCIGISEKTIPRCNQDLPFTSMTVEEVDGDLFSTQKNNHKKKDL